MSFTARYHSQCHACYERIRPGDQVTWDDSTIIHADCEEAEVPEREAPICPTCYLTRPCEHDEDDR